MFGSAIRISTMYDRVSMSSEQGSPSTRRVLLADVLALAGLILAGLKMTWGLSDGLDVGISDEDSYVHNGVILASTGIGAATGNPLYKLWYFGLSFLFPTPLDLYYPNFRAMTIVPFPLLYVVLRLLKVPAHVGFVVSWMLLVSRANANHDTRVGNFALIVMLVTFVAIFSARS